MQTEFERILRACMKQLPPGVGVKDDAMPANFTPEHTKDFSLQDQTPWRRRVAFSGSEVEILSTPTAPCPTCGSSGIEHLPYGERKRLVEDSTTPAKTGAN